MFHASILPFILGSIKIIFDINEGKKKNEYMNEE